VLRTATQAAKEHRAAERTTDIHALGKKGANYLRFLGEAVATSDTLIADTPRFDLAAGLADRLMDEFTSGAISAVDVAYMQFLSAGTQRPTVLRLLPLASPADETQQAAASRGEVRIDYTPAPEELLGELLPSTVRMRLFQCLTEAAASEQVARMVAMKAATDAAGDLIKLLTRQYNRARQTSITMELLDIIGGVAAIE
jgi:F-type H+-transporting ATPase subunit gamma